jgi:dephospho-CoA kinase
MITEGKIKEINKGKYLLGVTGLMGCGKSYTCKKLVSEAKEVGIKLHYIDVDVVGKKEVLGNNPLYLNYRKTLNKKLGGGLMMNDGSINREELGKRIFYNPQAMHAFKEIIYPATKEYIEQYLSDKQGIVLVEWALMVEDNVLPFVDYNVLIVKCDYETRMKRAKKRDQRTVGQIKKRTNLQLSYEQKEKQIKKIQEEMNKGLLYSFDTTNNPGDVEHKSLLEEMIASIN